MVTMEATAPLSLNETVGVTEFARLTLLNDARTGVVREYRLVGDEETVIEDSILAVWVEYDNSPNYRELYVTYGGTEYLVHRKARPHAGFTPFAKERLLYPTGHAKDAKTRVYVLGGRDPEGKRLRREMTATLLVVWMDYAALTEYTHLWVKWKDGKRHLVHRKGN